MFSDPQAKAVFLTAEQLELSVDEREALIRVLGMLEREELKWAPQHCRFKPQNGFNMLYIGGRNECGAVACLLGWCRILHGAALFDSPPRAASDLFMYKYPSTTRDKVSVAQAAQAMRNYLTTGKARWSEVLAHGNPYYPHCGIGYGYFDENIQPVQYDDCDPRQCVHMFRFRMRDMKRERPEDFEEFIAPLRGKNLACWCKPGAPCHADVLLELANAPSNG